jgi:hypothetical protein
MKGPLVATVGVALIAIGIAIGAVLFRDSGVGIRDSELEAVS